MITEKQIIKGCQKGVKSFQYELVRRYSPMLMAACMRFVQDRSKAEDVLQESLIRIFRNIDNYKTIGPFENWMRRITVRCAFSALDKSKIKREIELTDNHLIAQIEPEVYNTIGLKELNDLILKLPIGYRTVFNLKIIEGYSHKEIAELLEINESASRSQLTRAKRTLRGYLKEDQYKKSSAV